MGSIVGRMRGGRMAPAGCGVGVMLAIAVVMRPSAGAAPSAALSHPIDTDLTRASTKPTDERITVPGRVYRIAPTPYPGTGVMPWDAARSIRDPRTGADTTAFGNAFNLGNPLGSDERSSETGGAFVAPRHQ